MDTILAGTGRPFKVRWPDASAAHACWTSALTGKVSGGLQAASY